MVGVWLFGRFVVVLGLARRFPENALLTLGHADPDPPISVTGMLRACGSGPHAINGPRPGGAGEIAYCLA